MHAVADVYPELKMDERRFAVMPSMSRKESKGGSMRGETINDCLFIFLP